MRGAQWMLVLVACSDPPAPPRPAPPPPEVPTTTRISTSVELRWSKIVSTEGCFFFSGPEGRDDVLQGTATVERDDTSIRLTIGGARFDGAYRGRSLDLLRVSPHDFDGPWVTVETISGTYAEREMRARYRYHECHTGDVCPGRCEIDAELVLGP